VQTRSDLQYQLRLKGEDDFLEYALHPPAIVELRVRVDYLASETICDADLFGGQVARKVRQEEPVDEAMIFNVIDINFAIADWGRRFQNALAQSAQ
jgi:hypothetical protein